MKILLHECDNVILALWLAFMYNDGQDQDDQIFLVIFSRTTI